MHYTCHLRNIVLGTLKFKIYPATLIKCRDIFQRIQHAQKHIKQKRTAHKLHCLPHTSKTTARKKTFSKKLSDRLIKVLLKGIFPINVQCFEQLIQSQALPFMIQSIRFMSKKFMLIKKYHQELIIFKSQVYHTRHNMHIFYPVPVCLEMLTLDASSIFYTYETEMFIVSKVYKSYKRGSM